MMRQVVETIKVGLERELTDYEMVRLGETLDMLGFHRCVLNGKTLVVQEMCQTNRTWEHVWEKFDEQAKQG